MCEFGFFGFLFLFFFIFLYFYRLPEIGEDDPKVNPFIKEDGLPDFSTISVDKCIRRIGSQSKNLEDEIQNAETYLQNKSDLTPNEFFSNVLHPIEKADHELVSTWGLSKTLFHANNVPFPMKNFISMHQRARTANLAKYSNQSIFDAVKRLLDKYGNNTGALSTEQKRLLEMYALEGRMSGMELAKVAEREELQYHIIKVSDEMVTFESKVHVAIEHFSHTIQDYSMVQAFPSELLEAMAIDQKNPLNGPWKVTLKPYVYKTFMEYCPVREQRWNIWRANAQKASRQVVVELDNAMHTENIRDHRKRISELLGYDNHAKLKRERILLKDLPEEPETILKTLSDYAKPAQIRELTTLNDFAIRNGFQYAQLEEHDIPYWRRKYNISECNYDENLIQEYFPKDKVINGLLQLSESLFNIKIIEREVDRHSKWHEDVKLYDVYDANVESELHSDEGRYIGSVYLDTNNSFESYGTFSEPYGAISTIREHCEPENQTPLVSLVYNFRAPLYGKPHTLKLNEVHVLFSRFANALQKIMNQTNYRELSGLMNIEYVNDKICSNVFSNLLYSDDVLKAISEHVSTKEPLNDEHIKAIQSQRLTLAGYNLSMELFKASLDLELNTTQNWWLDCLRKNWTKYFTHELDKRDARLLSMLDVMVGNWSGCYFATIWAQIVASDIYNAFAMAYDKNDKKTETINTVGSRFRDTFLVSGSNTDSKELFRTFRARDPAIEPFIIQLKINKID